jgi:hypothetical protein
MLKISSNNNKKKSGIQLVEEIKVGEVNSGQYLNQDKIIDI